MVNRDYVPFSAAKLKIERARSHFQDFKSLEKELVSADPYVALLVKNEGNNQLYISILSRSNVPDSLSVVFGDCIYNLRSSLDILANDIVTLSGNKPHKVYFPFGNDSEGFEGEMKRKLRGASEEAKSIIRSLQPFRGGNELLRALHDLNIQDKHVAIIDANYGQSVTPNPEAIVMLPNGVFYTDFSKLTTVDIDTTGFQVSCDETIIGKLTNSICYVHIASDQPLSGRKAVEALSELVDLCHGIIQTFEGHFLEQTPNPVD